MLGHVYHHINVHRRNKPFTGSQAGDAMTSQWAASWVDEVSIQCVSGFWAVLPRSIVDSSGGLDMWMWGTLYPCIQLPRSPGWHFGHVCRHHFLRKMMWCVFDLEAFFPSIFSDEQLGQCSFLQHQFMWLVHQSMSFLFHCVKMCQCVGPRLTFPKDALGSPTLIGQYQWQVVMIFRYRGEAT